MIYVLPFHIFLWTYSVWSILHQLDTFSTRRKWKSKFSTREKVITFERFLRMFVDGVAWLFYTEFKPFSWKVQYWGEKWQMGKLGKTPSVDDYNKWISKDKFLAGLQRSNIERGGLMLLKERERGNSVNLNPIKWKGLCQAESAWVIGYQNNPREVVWWMGFKIKANIYHLLSRDEDLKIANTNIHQRYEYPKYKWHTIDFSEVYFGYSAPKSIPMAATQ